jgi:hypothetical protein
MAIHSPNVLTIDDTPVNRPFDRNVQICFASHEELRGSDLREAVDAAQRGALDQWYAAQPQPRNGWWFQQPQAERLIAQARLAEIKL